MNAYIQQIRNLGPTRLAIAGGIGVALIAFLIYMATRMGGPDMALLYSDLNAQDAGKITQRLDQLNVPYQLRGDGTTVLVPVDQVARTRITLASEGIPSGGSIGYEIFDKSQGMTSSSFVQNINQLRAVEGELSRTIAGIEGVRQARVHLVLPQRELFSRERQEPSASVVVHMRGPQRLEKPQVVAIQNIVAASVPGLKAERIAIMDERGTLLARSITDGQSSIVALQTAEELRVGYETRLARAVESMLERSLGFGKVRAEVNAQIDYARTNQNEEIFNPDQQVLRSSQTVNDSSEQNETDGNPSVTIANNLPQGQGNQAGMASSNSRTARTEETLNYEISRVVRNSVIEPGGIKRVSVAVMVDNITSFDENGNRVSRARTQQELDKLSDLVKSAVGFDAGRGDSVEVVNLPFASLDDDKPPAPKLFGMDRDELVKLAEIFVLGLVVLLVVRPLLARLFEAVPAAASAGAGAALLGGGAVAGQLTGPGGSGMLPAIEVGDSIEEMIDLSRIEGRVKASSLRKIGEIIEKHPEDVVAILRNWLYQESGA